MHYIDPARGGPLASLSWFARPCIDAFSVVQRRLGWSAACVAAGSFGCRVEFARRGVLLAITYWLGLPPVVELVRSASEAGSGARSRVTFPWLPPRALPRVVASLHARLRAAAGDFTALEQDADEAVAPAERPALERAMRGHLRVVAADLLRRHRDELTP
jgi:hypothetical protein